MGTRPVDAIFIIHRVVVGQHRKPGGLDLVMEIMSQRGWRSAVVEHPLDGRGPSVLRFQDGSPGRAMVEGLRWCRWGTLRWMLEPAWTVWIARRHVATHRATIAVAADPLNAVAGWLLRRLAVVKALWFHVADFSPQRFGRRWLDQLYLALYRFSARRADVTTAVSQRIVEYTQGLAGVDARRIVRFPNSPVIAAIPTYPIAQRHPGRLVMVAGTISSWVGLEPVLEGIRLARATVPHVRLRIVGGFLNAEDERRLMSQIRQWGLEGVVDHTGFVPHDEVVRIIASSWIGVAYYSGRATWSYYSDSMKIWEYAAAGLPVIANGLLGTAEEARRAGGACVADTPDQWRAALGMLCMDQRVYAEMGQRARAWASAHDKAGLVDQLLQRLKVTHG